MTELERHLPDDDPRIEIVRAGNVGSGPVLLWVQRDQRASGNHAANLAVEIANQIAKPVVAAFCLAPAYPRATLRAYRFMAEGLRELPEAFAERKIGWVLRAGDPAEMIPALVDELKASIVVTDQAPTQPARGWKADVAARIAVPLVAVDADVVVPTALFPTLEWAPRTIRPKIRRVLSTYLVPIDDPEAHHPSLVREDPDPVELIDRLTLDRTVGPSPRATGGQIAARERLHAFCASHLPTYDVDRNRADIDGSSGLSPYLHFGQIGPLEVALTALESQRRRIQRDAIDTFLDELIVQRELAINFALRQPGHDTFTGIPDWGKKTLAKHASDERAHLYSRDELESALTHDPLWNAAQLQMVHEGFMPNRLRMYWAKQIALWTRAPDDAFDLAVQLNDRYFLDGRDANGYAGISWAIGGRHDRPFPPERPVLGLVRPMGAKGMRKYFDVDRYIASIAARYGERAPSR